MVRKGIDGFFQVIDPDPFSLCDYFIMLDGPIHSSMEGRPMRCIFKSRRHHLRGMPRRWCRPSPWRHDRDPGLAYSGRRSVQTIGATSPPAKKRRRHNRALLLNAPATSTLDTGNDMNLGHRTVSCIGANDQCLHQWRDYARSGPRPVGGRHRRDTPYGAM